MSEERLLQLYALALTMVPDENVAGDLFLQARDPVHLHSLAARWLRQNGLPVPAAGMEPPMLNGAQIEEGLHLIRRRASRRRTGIGLLGTVVAMVAVVVLLALSPLARRPSAFEPASLGQPVARLEMEGVRFDVYSTEATPGSITVTWSMSGRDAWRMAAPEMEVAGRGHGPDRVEILANRGDFVAGRTVYQVVTAGWLNARLRVLDESKAQLKGSLAVDLRYVVDPAARNVPVEQALLAPNGEPLGAVTRVSLAPTYTTVTYRPEVGLTQGVMLLADGEPVNVHGELHGLRAPESGERVYVFDPVAPGTTALEVALIRQMTERRLRDQNGWEREGTMVTAAMAVDADAVSEVQAYFVDHQGVRYPARAQVEQQRGGLAGLKLSAAGVPADVDLRALEVKLQVMMLSLPVDVALEPS